jgi:uncharacterized protein YkwD
VPAVTFALLLIAGALLLAATVASPLAAQTGLGADEQAVLDIVNRERAAAGLGPLSFSSQLTDAAAWMAADLAQRDLLDHTDSQGRGIRARFSAFGFPTNTYIGENLHAGRSDPEEVVGRWMASSGHRDNILNGNYTLAGIGRVYVPETRYGYFWVLTFGSGSGDPAPSPQPSTAQQQSRAVSGFAQPFPTSGFALNTWSGGSLQHLVDAASSGGGRSIFVSTGGRLVGHVIGAPAFVNADFAAAFSGGQVPAGTGVLIVV